MSTAATGDDRQFRGYASSNPDITWCTASSAVTAMAAMDKRIEEQAIRSSRTSFSALLAPLSDASEEPTTLEKRLYKALDKLLWSTVPIYDDVKEAAEALRVYKSKYNTPILIRWDGQYGYDKSNKLVAKVMHIKTTLPLYFSWCAHYVFNGELGIMWAPDEETLKNQVESTLRQEAKKNGSAI